MTNDPLLQPFQLKHLTIKNRVLSTAHEPAYTEDRMPAERYRLYLEEKAKGGVGLNMFGGSSTVSIDSPAAFGNIDNSLDEVVEHYRLLAEAVHRHGAALMNQITHLGRRTSFMAEYWLPVISASNVREMAHRIFPKVAEQEDIDRIAADYGRAARRCKDGGLDGVEVMATGHLLDSFLSPRTNNRDDDYGGSLDNRVRFGMEVLEQVRKAVGDDYIVGMRLMMDERVRGGIDGSMGYEIARRFVDSGMIDFLNVNIFAVDSDDGLSKAIPVMGTPTAPHLELVREIKQTFGLPVFHAARINDFATARHAIESGAMDMVGMTRPHLADPHIVNKMAQGKEDRIRPCVGAGFCIDQIYQIGYALCLHNPATGREKTIPHVVLPSDNPGKKAVVVGAGPAGLEAARVLAERGHKVVLFEATERTGGQVITASKAPRRRDLIGITDWLTSECEVLGVDIRYNTYAEAGEIDAEDPDIVIVATGGVPNTDFLEEGEDLVVSTWDILNGQVSPAESVLIYDENGREPGPACAEYLATQKAAIQFVTPDRIVGPEIGGTNNPPILKAFYQAGIQITTDHRLLGVKRDGNKLVATLLNNFTDQTEERRIDQVITEYGTTAVDEVYFAMKDRSVNSGQLDLQAIKENRPQTNVSNPEGAFRLIRVGDAVHSRNIHAAIFESRRLCMHL